MVRRRQMRAMLGAEALLIALPVRVEAAQRCMHNGDIGRHAEPKSRKMSAKAPVEVVTVPRVERGRIECDLLAHDPPRRHEQTIERHNAFDQRRVGPEDR